MTDFAFRLLVLSTGLVTVVAVVADEIGARGLPGPLQQFHARSKAAVLAASRKNPLLAALRIGLFLGYLAALAALATFAVWGPVAYLALSVAWSVLSWLDAPHILSKPYVVAYELSLLLNGAVLALCFASPLASRFAGI